MLTDLVNVCREARQEAGDRAPGGAGERGDLERDQARGPRALVRADTAPANACADGPTFDMRGEVVFCQLRPDSPRAVDGKARKCELPARGAQAIDVPPRVPPKGRRSECRWTSDGAARPHHHRRLGDHERGRQARARDRETARPRTRPSPWRWPTSSTAGSTPSKGVVRDRRIEGAARSDALVLAPRSSRPRRHGPPVELSARSTLSGTSVIARSSCRWPALELFLITR